jgi:hypothetical protein
MFCLFMIAFEDFYLKSKELNNLTFFDKGTDKYFSIFLNFIQISLSPIIFAFILPIWIRLNNTQKLDISALL